MNPEDDNPYHAPRSDLHTEFAPDQRLLQLPRFSAWYVLGLMILTLGLYYPYWLYTRTRIINRVHTRPIPMNLVIVILGLYLLAQVFAFLNGYYPQDSDYENLARLTGLASAFADIFWVFMVRKRIHEMAGTVVQQGYWLNAIFSFFIQVIYLQYKINEYHDSYSQQGPQSQLAV